MTTTERLNRIVMVCLVLIAAQIIGFFYLREQDHKEQLAAASHWDAVTVAAEIGRWSWNVTDNSIRWDEAMGKLFNCNHVLITTYQAFAALVEPNDAARVGALCKAAIDSRTGYRALFKLRDGKVIRAIGKVTEQSGKIFMTGICVEGTVLEYNRSVSFNHADLGEVEVAKINAG